MAKSLKISIVVAMITMVVGKVTYDETIAVASAYLYGYPLVLMDETRADSIEHAPINVLGHNQELPDADFRTVVGANVDTLYSNAWLDLKEEPLVVSMPDTNGRYYVLPFTDAWINFFTHVGKSTTGTDAQEIAVVGPEFNGDLPEGFSVVVKSPTNMTWLIGRIQVNGESDIPSVVEIQNGMALTPLSAWRQGERWRGVNSHLMTAGDQKSGPMHRLQAMSHQEFFSRLNALMVEQPPFPRDQEMLSGFSHLKIAPGAEFKWEELSWFQKKLMDITVAAFNGYSDVLLDYWLDFDTNGWALGSKDRAERYAHGFGTDYFARALIAKIGLGGLPPKEATYPITDRTVDGERLNGITYNYRLSFPAGKLPPADAFWSLTVYDREGFLVKNEINRYSLGDRSDITFNADGSLDVYLQKDRPEEHLKNWLPAPDGEFRLALRIYMPKTSALNGEWIPPALVKTVR